MKHKYIEIQKWKPESWDTESIKRYKRKKTFYYSVKNIKHDERIGWISWNKGWRKYAFYPKSDITFDSNCLNFISRYMEDLNGSTKTNRRIKRRKIIKNERRKGR